MRNNYFKFGALCTAFATSLSAVAIDPPQIPTQELTDGGKYVLLNKVVTQPCLYRTNWDGAFFFGPIEGSSDAVAGSTYLDNQLQAVKNADGTWSFTMTTPADEEGAEDVVTYFTNPFGSGNVFMREDPASWIVEASPKYEGYYMLTPGAGNNENTFGYYLHLNKGKNYVIISYPGGPYHPDYEVKTEVDSDGGTYPVYDDRGAEIHADSTHFNWAFVDVSAIPAYAGKVAAYQIIAPYEEAYLAEPGFETGFKAGYDAVMAIYENPEYKSEDLASIKAIVDSKVALYNEIVKAIDLNATEDAALDAAIAEAQTVFDTSVVPEELDAAMLALLDAESTYSQGGGDYTSLGKNMSFEDLSAQNGNTTTGVAAPPTGWNLYLNGNLVTTASEIQANGVANWCGVNADCIGEAKDGNYGFGIWTAGLPSVELSQTIEGLENGTYTVSAALMVGANGAGSRRTTQRVFGNLNSTYFASQAEYDLDKLDKSEVYGFADLVEPVTDTELQPISVRAYVYDGTLTFGLRTDGNVTAANRTTSNANGGDGWFKIDNFRITKEGYSAKDALAVLAHYVDILDNWSSMDVPMSLDVKQQLDASITELGGVDGGNSATEIDDAILSAKDLLDVVDASVRAYEELYAAIEQHYGYLEKYQDMPGAEVYSEIIYEIENNYYDGIYSTEGVSDAIAELDAALDACKRSEISVGKDITYIISNPSFENQVATQPNGDSGGLAAAPKGWNVIVDGDTCKTATDMSSHGIANWCAINSGDPISVELSDGTIVTQQPTEGSKLWGIWTPNVPNVELSQELVGLPAGTYTLTADVMVQYNWAGKNLTTQRIFANNYMQMFGSEEAHALNLPEDAQGAVAWDVANPDADIKHLTYAGYTCESGDPTTDLLKTMTVTFGVDETGVAKIGFRTNNVDTNGISRDEGGIDGQGWFKVDNFTLFYDSEDIPTAIGSVKTDGAVTTIVGRQYFTVGGVQVSAPQKGVNIVKNVMSDGSVKVCKVILK